MKITSAVFDVSAPDFASCPQETFPEFALIGRSNVGKSTLLNRLAEKRDLARVSATPGFTKMLNFYTINRRWRLVDLPGYGFAKTSQQERARYTRLIEDYLLKRSNLACVLVLVDSSIPPQAADLDFVQWIGRADRPFALVFTKEDKAKGNKAMEHIEQFMGAVNEWFEEPPLMFVTSAKNQIGVRELQHTIAQAASGDPDSDQDER
jgi:GTP-binding protein